MGISVRFVGWFLPNTKQNRLDLIGGNVATFIRKVVRRSFGMVEKGMSMNSIKSVLFKSWLF